MKARLKCIGGLPKLDRLLAHAEQNNIPMPKTFGADCVISIDGEAVKIETVQAKLFPGDYTVTESFAISEGRIIDVDIISNENIEEKQKSVIGRGLVGAAVFGPVGAIVGGLSGTGAKQRITVTRTLCIAYEKASNGNCGNLLFRIDQPHEHIAALSFIEEFNTTFKRAPQADTAHEDMARDKDGNILL